MATVQEIRKGQEPLLPESLEKGSKDPMDEEKENKDSNESNEELEEATFFVKGGVSPHLDNVETNFLAKLVKSYEQ